MIRTELEGVGKPVGDHGVQVAIIRETDQQVVLGHLGEKRMMEFEGICEQRLVQRRPAYGTVCTGAGHCPQGKFWEIERT